MSTVEWVRLAGWGNAHVIDGIDGSEEVVLGVTYTRTLCGRRVRSADVCAEGEQTRCLRCAHRSGLKAEGEIK